MDVSLGEQMLLLRRRRSIADAGPVRDSSLRGLDQTLVPQHLVSVCETRPRPQVNAVGCVTRSQGNVDHYVELSRLPADDRDSCGDDVADCSCGGWSPHRW